MGMEGERERRAWRGRERVERERQTERETERRRRREGRRDKGRKREGPEREKGRQIEREELRELKRERGERGGEKGGGGRVSEEKREREIRQKATGCTCRQAAIDHADEPLARAEGPLDCVSHHLCSRPPERGCTVGPYICR